MITLPDPIPGTPDTRSSGRFVLWLARRQWRTLLLAITFGVLWMLTQAVMPWGIGRTIDEGVATGDRDVLLRWCAALLLLGVLQAGTGVLRHRMAVYNWLQATMRIDQLIGHHVADAGRAVTARTTTGEVVSTVANDAPRVGDIFDVMARFVGSVVAFAAVAVLLLRVDVALGLLVLLGVPALTATLAFVVRPLQARRHAQREAEGTLTALGADTVAGLRVLRGIGGEAQFVGRYRERSQQVRAAGVRVAGVQATLDAAQVLLPGAFVVLLTWLGARAAVTGRISAGELVTLYGYAAFLALPLSNVTETLNKAVRARVALRRILAVLRVHPVHAGAAPAAPATWVAGQPLHDPTSGLVIEPGLLTAVVAPVPDEAGALADRLARLDADLPEDPHPDAAVPTVGGVGVDRFTVAELRRHVLVNEAEPRLFTGVLREEIDPGRTATDDEVRQALTVADADDVLDALPDGLDAVVDERGRSFSGGQRQRLALARAVLAAPEVLVLVEPTSAVDAHTEARIAGRLREARHGRTTVVATASPLLLDAADRVVFLVEGRVVAEGTHRELMSAVPAYRWTVTRETESR